MTQRKGRDLTVLYPPGFGGVLTPQPDQPSFSPVTAGEKMRAPREIPRLPMGPLYFGACETYGELTARFKRDYGIDVDEITEVRALTQASQRAARKLTPRQIRKFAVEALRAYDQAWKNSQLTNLSGHYKGYSMQFERGPWEVATNMEHARNCTYCGERSAVNTLWNRALSRTNFSRFKSEQDLERFRDKLKVKNMVMADASSPYAMREEEHNINPCSECLHTMNVSQYFTPETCIVRLCRDGEEGPFYLTYRQIQDFMPFMGRQQPSLTSQSIDELPVAWTERALLAVDEKAAVEAMAKSYLQEARANYEEALAGQPDMKQVFVRARFEPDDEAVSERRFTHSKRWQIPAEEVVAVIGRWLLEREQGEDVPFTIPMLAYYGNNPAEIPNLDSLGRLTQSRASGQTLLVMIEEDAEGDDVIQIRTIYDYMPFLYR